MCPGLGGDGATVPGAEGTSGWGSSRFLSLLLVRVSLVSEGSAFRLRGSWLRDLHTTGHTQLMPPTTATLLSCCRSPPSCLHHPSQYSTEKGHANSRCWLPYPQGKADPLFLGAQTTFQALGDRREVMPRARTPPEPHNTRRAAAHDTVGAVQIHHDTHTDATMIFLNSPRMNN